MKNKTVFGLIMGMTACMGLLPFLLSFALAQYLLDHGASVWPARTFEIAMTAVWLALFVAGTWLCAIWFGD
jgi:hypothetical protein